MWIPTSGLVHLTRALDALNGTAASGAAAEPAWMQVWSPSTIHALVWTWLGLNIVGQVLLTLLLATFFFSRRLRSQRHPVVLNFVVTWLLSTIPSCLLLYAGSAEGRQPDAAVCLFNAALVAGIPGMEAVAFLAVVIQVFVMLRSVAANKTYVRRTWLTVVLLASPYVVYIAFSLMVGVIGFYDPLNVTRDAEIVYCSVSNHNAGTYIWGFTVLIVIVTFVLGIWVVVMLYKNWRDVRGGKVASEFDVHLVIRALAFAVFELFILVMSLLAIFRRDSIPPKFMQALAPTAVFLIFATQPDMIFSWFFCFGRRASPDDDSSMTRASSHMSTQGFAANGEKFAYESNTARSTNTARSLPISERDPNTARSLPISERDPFQDMPVRGPQRLYVDTTRASFTPRPESSASASGPRPLMLSTSALPAVPNRAQSSASPQRPPSHMSSSSLGSAYPQHPHHPRQHTRPPRAGAGRGHNRSASSSTATSSVYSAVSAGSAVSQAPLLRTVEEFRPTADVQRDGSYKSQAGVLGRRAGSDGKL